MPSSPPIRSELDHLVRVCPDLEADRARVETLLGVRPRVGGRHPGIGTHNALVNLDQDRYVELLAPDPSQHQRTSFGRWVEGVERARLATWAGRTDDLDALVEAARTAGLEPGPILALSRQRPDGSVLSWRLAQVGGPRSDGHDADGHDADGHDADGRLPFFIEWGRDSAGRRLHACDALSDQGCRFLALELHGPRTEKLREHLRALGFAAALGSQITLHEAEHVSLRSRLAVPGGERVLD